MERELWPELYRAIKHVGSLVRQKSVQYQPWVLAMVYLWAALHDRPPSWACVASYWSSTRPRPLALPSPSTLSRRVYRVSRGVFWRQLEDYLRQTTSWAFLSFVDGKPLVVGNASKDRDARRGRAAGGFAKGYKLQSILANHPLPEAWAVTPLNAAESVVAQDLIRQIPPGGYLLADGCYDSGPLFDRAWERGYQMLVPCESSQAGRGPRRQSLAGLRSIALFPTKFGQELLAQRIRIEQSFGQLTSFAGGLGPLPAWVRRHRRVRIWVWSKLMINAIRLRRLKQQALAA